MKYPLKEWQRVMLRSQDYPKLKERRGTVVCDMADFKVMRDDAYLVKVEGIGLMCVDRRGLKLADW